MASIQVYRFAEGKVEKREEDVASLGKRPHRRLLREAVQMYESNQRAGTHETKTRAEVDYTNKKPWAQKHTGRARAGTRRSPLWRGGGVIHGPHARDYSFGMPRKALRAAVRSALLGKFLDDEVAAIDGVTLDAPSTKKVATALRALELDGSTLLVTPARDDVFYRSARNIRGATVRTAAEVNAYDLLAATNVVLVNGALEALVKAVGPAAGTVEGSAPGKAPAAQKAAAKKAAAKKPAKPAGKPAAKAAAKRSAKPSEKDERKSS
jgi:large subunit ribosomal protein L4